MSMKKFVPAIILSFLLCVSLFGTVLCLSFKSTWLNKELTLDELGSQNYYNVMYDTILSSCESIGIPSGIPVEVFVEVLSRDTINQYIRESIECLYTNTAFSIDKETLRESLHDAFRQYGKDIKADVYSQEVKDALNELADYCVSKYTELIQFPFMKQLSPYVSKAASIIDTVSLGCVAVSAVFIALLILICRTSSAQYIGASLTGSGLLCIIPTAVLLSGAPYKNINLGTEVFYKFAVSFIESGLLPVLYAGISMVAIGIVANIISGLVIHIIFGNKNRSYKS